MGILVSLQEATTELIRHLNRALQVSDEIAGLMQRSARGDPRFLIGMQIVKRGASFQHNCVSILHHFRTKYPHEIQKIKIVFLTAIPSIVDEMKKYREQLVQSVI